MVPYCIFEFDLFTEDDFPVWKSQSWLVEIPCSADKLLCIDSGKLSCLNNLNENKSTVVRICFVRPFDDFVTVDSELYSNYDSFTYLGKQKYKVGVFYVFGKIIEKRDMDK